MYYTAGNLQGTPGFEIVKMNITKLLTQRNRCDLIPIWDEFLLNFPADKVDTRVPCENMYEEVEKLHKSTLRYYYNDRIFGFITILLYCRSISKECLSDCDVDEDVDKHDLVEPVVYRNGPMSAASRNDIYIAHNVPGIGKRTILTEKEIREKKVSASSISII